MNDPSDCVSRRLGAAPVVMDSGDCCMVSRPRLWWVLTDWKEVRHHPLTGEKLQWSQHNGYRQVRLGPNNMDLGGLQFHRDVVDGKRKIPCFTTPAPDAQGRPPPAMHKLKTSAEAKQRWLNDNRQFAPWQYADHAMMYRDDEPEVTSRNSCTTFQRDGPRSMVLHIDHGTE